MLSKPIHATRLTGALARLLAVTAAGALLPAAALAQDAAQAAPQDEDQGSSNSGGLGDIIVTATKREQRLQDVPVSITAVGGAQIEELKITDLRSIQSYVPNMAVLNSGVNPVVFIRGFGSGPNNVAFDQEVSVYLDGIYGGRGAQFSAPFFDLERMEVLRGPQGALFGRNTAAGAISLISAKPGNQFEGYATAGYDFERRGYDLTGVVSAPLGDTFGVRFAGKITHQDGYIRNGANGELEPRLRDELARVTAVWRPSDGIDVTAKVEYGRHLLLGGVNVSGYVTQPTDFANASDNRFVSNNVANSGMNEHSGIKTWNGALTGNFDIGDHTLTVIGGYSHFTTQRLSAYDERNSNGTVPPNQFNGKFANAFPEDFTQWSGEVRLSSPVGQFLEYVIGAYYDTSDYHLHQDSFYVGLGATGTTTGHQSTDYYQTGDSLSFYGQATVNFTDALRLIAGVRYSKTTKEATFEQANISGVPRIIFRPDLQQGMKRVGDLSEDYVDPSATLQFDITDDIMVYATYARGSKSGGFVSNTYNVLPAAFQFAPERSTNYEAGLKSTFADGKATFNVAVFNTEFKDLQQSSYVPLLTTFITTNAAKARSRGVEVELQLRPARSLTFNASIAYLDAEFTDYPGAPCLALNPTCGTTFNLKGYPLQFAPEWSGNAGFRHELEAGDFKIVSGANIQFRSDYWVGDGYNPIWGEQDGWAKVDARIQVGPSDDRWNIALIGRNLFDTRTRGAALNLPTAITGTNRTIHWMDEYRSVNLNATVRF